MLLYLRKTKLNMYEGLQSGTPRSSTGVCTPSSKVNVDVRVGAQN